MFTGRKNELALLEEQYINEKSSFVVVYGRRRIGKTALIAEFMRNKRRVYFLANEETDYENRQRFLRQVCEYSGDDKLQRYADARWEDIFTALAAQADGGRIIVAIDEFQYLCKNNHAMSSIIQSCWDTILNGKNIMLILCGSLVNMMETQVLNYGSPLYGRRTAQIRLKQLAFSESIALLPDATLVDKIKRYSVCGGVPKYLETLNRYKDLGKAITTAILSPGSLLYEEPYFLLDKELQNVGSYFAIIRTIAQGERRLGGIAAKLGVSQSALTNYLKILSDLDLIERVVPVTEKDPARSKRGLYYIRDGFIEFWFKFVYPNRDRLEIGRITDVARTIDSRMVEQHSAFVFERVCREIVFSSEFEKRTGIVASACGRWWNSTGEIDLVAFDDHAGQVAYCECKFHNRAVDGRVLYNLQNRSREVDCGNKYQQEYFALFSVSGFTTELQQLADEQKNIILVNVQEYLDTKAQDGN